MVPEPQANPDELLSLARKGSGTSLGELLEMYSNYLKLVAAVHIDERLRARFSPSDVVQETFFEAHRDFHQFRGADGRAFLAWVRQILVNNLARLVEKHLIAARRDVRREVSMTEIGAGVGQSAARIETLLADHCGSPSSQADRNENLMILADELAELPPDYREVVVLRHLKGLPFQDVAQRMERSGGAVRMLWLRAIETLRRRLKKRGVL